MLLDAVHITFRALGGKWMNVWEKVQQAFYGKGFIYSRPAYCASFLSSQLGSYAILLRRHFHDEIQANVAQMVAKLRESYSRLITGTDWMDEETKTKALQKLEAMEVVLGYRTKEAANETFVEEHYKDVSHHNATHPRQ